MLRCAKCGTKNSFSSDTCSGCGTRLLMGMTVVKTYRHDPKSKFILTLAKYLFAIIGLYLLWQAIDILWMIKDDGFTGIMFTLVLYGLAFVPGLFIVYFCYKMLDFAIKSSDHYESVDPKEDEIHDEENL